MTLLFLDNETGGLEEQNSVLSIAMYVYRFGRTRIFKKDSMLLFTRPNDNNYVVNPEALKINRINLLGHFEESITYKEAGTRIYDFLKKNMEGEEDRLVLCGQKVEGDRDSLFAHKIINPNTWEMFVEHRVLDTLVIGKFACLCGIWPEKQKLSLTCLAQALGIKVDSKKLHQADYDVELNAKVLFGLRNLFDAGNTV